MSNDVHAEIEYLSEDDERGYSHLVHSDICPPECDLNNLSDDYRQFLHKCLDEWLDKSRATGIFYITGEAEKYLKRD